MQQPVAMRTCFESSKFTVQSWRFEDPQLGPFNRDVVVHPGAVLIVPLLEGGRVVMVHNVRDAVGQELLELPAGTLESGEAVQACASRELEEETGYRAGVLEPLCEFYTCPGFCTEKMHAFVARGLTRTAPRPERFERIRIAIMSLPEVMRMIAEGGIIDGKTIAALSVLYLRKQGNL